MRFCFASSTTQDGAALLRDSWCAARRRPAARFAAAPTPRSRLAPCMNAAVMPRRSEKMTRTVSSSRRVTPDERLIARTNVVLRSGLSVPADASQLELVGVREGLRRGVLLGHDRVFLAVLREAVLLHRGLGPGEILVVHVDQGVPELVAPLPQLVVAEVPVGDVLARAVAVDVGQVVLVLEEDAAAKVGGEAGDEGLDAVVHVVGRAHAQVVDRGGRVVAPA